MIKNVWMLACPVAYHSGLEKNLEFEEKNWKNVWRVHTLLFLYEICEIFYSALNWLARIFSVSKLSNMIHMKLVFPWYLLTTRDHKNTFRIYYGHNSNVCSCAQWNMQMVPTVNRGWIKYMSSMCVCVWHEFASEVGSLQFDVHMHFNKILVWYTYAEWHLADL